MDGEALGIAVVPPRQFLKGLDVNSAVARFRRSPGPDRAPGKLPGKQPGRWMAGARPSELNVAPCFKNSGW